MVIKISKLIGSWHQLKWRYWLRYIKIRINEVIRIINSLVIVIDVAITISFILIKIKYDLAVELLAIVKLVTELKFK